MAIAINFLPTITYTCAVDGADRFVMDGIEAETFDLVLTRIDNEIDLAIKVFGWALTSTGNRRGEAKPLGAMPLRAIGRPTPAITDWAVPALREILPRHPELAGLLILQLWPEHIS